MGSRLHLSIDNQVQTEKLLGSHEYIDKKLINQSIQDLKDEVLWQSKYNNNSGDKAGLIGRLENIVKKLERSIK